MANRTSSFVCCPLPVVSVSKKPLDFRICGTFPKRLQMGIWFWGAFLLFGLFASICFFILYLKRMLVFAISLLQFWHQNISTGHATGKETILGKLRCFGATLNLKTFWNLRRQCFSELDLISHTKKILTVLFSRNWSCTRNNKRLLTRTNYDLFCSYSIIKYKFNNATNLGRCKVAHYTGCDQLTWQKFARIWKGRCRTQEAGG